MAINGAWQYGSFYYGDWYDNRGSSYTASADRITGDAEQANTYVSGDFRYVGSGTTGGRFWGGDDNIDVSARYIYGDAQNGRSNSILYAGDDEITVRENLVDDYYYVYGDISSTAATVYGGDDSIVGHRNEDATGYFYGDGGIVHSRGGGYGGDDSIKATNAADFIFGDFQNTAGAARANGGDDKIWGYGGDDYIVGDVETGGNGFREAGNDYINGGRGDDTIYGDIKNDVNSTIGGDDKINAGKGHDKVWAGGGDDIVNGGKGRDALFGGAGDDMIKGGKGRDSLYGGRGEDTLKGGKGNDRLDGGYEADTMTGGKGADTFIFNSVDGDHVTDFSRKQGDKIDLSGIDEITDWNDLRSNHLVDTPGSDSFAIRVNGESVLVDGLDFNDVMQSDFIF